MFWYWACQAAAVLSLALGSSLPALATLIVLAGVALAS